MQPIIQVATTVAIAVLGVSATQAQSPSAIEKWTGPEAPQCVSVSEMRSAASVIELTPEQFQFARALYVLIPPVSQTLPPGDHAVMASQNGLVMVAFVADDKACARFLAPPVMQEMLIQVGEGRIVKPGDDI